MTPTGPGPATDPVRATGAVPTAGPGRAPDTDRTTGTGPATGTSRTTHTVPATGTRPGPATGTPAAPAGAAPPVLDPGLLARRATADPLFRLAAYALEAAHGVRPGGVWSAPYAFHLGSPGLVAAAGWPVAAAAAPRTDGLVRLSSLSHPAHSCDLPLTLSGPPPDTPGWAVRPYAVLRALARAGYGRGGCDLHVQGSLTEAAGLATAEPAECALALAVTGVHAEVPPPREELARLLARALPDGDDALRRAVLFARPGQALLLRGSTATAGGQPPRHVAFDPAASGSRLVLVAVRGEPAAVPDDVARAMTCARRAGALSAWPPGDRPGRSVLVLLPRDRSAAVRTAVVEDFRARDRPVPRFLNIAVAGAARREA
ncbi:galactokinase [Streptomyces antimicrobicus]|uniref:Galactokinase n=1 Tax=Streptomyces antimicrobicus TaxID=2883108 RepID=A0ABS8BCN6_9ACTN|nr:galactokinase [Streptomyces antimicrobicus]MCB5182405.1 galactokinase [Streptomyces antimicrobicus]